MQALVEVGAGVAGILMGLGAARLALAGILTLTFGRRLSPSHASPAPPHASLCALCVFVVACRFV